MAENTSEIARLREQIENEHAAACWALSGLASGNVQHAFIQRRMRHLEISYQGLANVIGEKAATQYMCDVFEKSPPQKH
jgi:hypothetical protein